MARDVDWSDLKAEEPILFSPGSHLSDVPPDYHGMSLKRWMLKRVELLARELPKTKPETEAAIHGPRNGDLFT